MDNYAFLASVYKNTKVDEMKLCVDCMVNQTVPPSQIVIVEDGPIPSELDLYLSRLESESPNLYKLVVLEDNVGLGVALREGMKVCDYELIARIDTDDVCVKCRCEKQLKVFEEHPEFSVVGSNMSEFIDDTDNVVAIREVPEHHEDICKYLKKRCPFNHITVMLKKSAVMRAGGYEHWLYDEDSFLWIRMYLSGAVFYNIQEVLASARVGKDMYKRRGGLTYYKSERDLFKYMYDNKIINFFELQKEKAIRFILYVLMPNGIRGFLFRKLARKTK